MKHTEHNFFGELIDYSGSYKSQFSSMYKNIDLFSEYLDAGKDMESCASKARNFLEAAVNFIYSFNATLRSTRTVHKATNQGKDMTLFEKINVPEFRTMVGESRFSKMNKIRMFGNRGSHDDITNESTNTREITPAEAEAVYPLLIDILYLVSETAQLLGRTTGLKSDWIDPKILAYLNRKRKAVYYVDNPSLNPDLDFCHFKRLRKIHIPPRVANTYKGNAYLLHEIGHSDASWFERNFTIVKHQEAASWRRAKRLAKKLGIPDKGEGLTWDAIQSDALKTYKNIGIQASDWKKLFKRMFWSLIRFNVVGLGWTLFMLSAGDEPALACNITEIPQIISNLVTGFVTDFPGTVLVIKNYFATPLTHTGVIATFDATTCGQAYIVAIYKLSIFALIRRIPMIISFLRGATDQTLLELFRIKY